MRAGLSLDGSGLSALVGGILGLCGWYDMMGTYLGIYSLNSAVVFDISLWLVGCVLVHPLVRGV